MTHESPYDQREAKAMTDLQAAIAENVVTLIAACLCAYFISPWCFLLLLNINSGVKKS